jgi:hypothetical protein
MRDGLKKRMNEFAADWLPNSLLIIGYIAIIIGVEGVFGWAVAAIIAGGIAFCLGLTSMVFGRETEP